MKIVKALLDSENPNLIFYFDEHGNSKIEPYPPTTSVGKALVKELGGHHEISHATYKHSEAINREMQIFHKFKESKIKATEIYAIDSLMAEVLSKEELMKLKLTIFDHEFVKNSKNRELITSVRKSEDPIDLIMYFGMLRKEADVS